MKSTICAPGSAPGIHFQKVWAPMLQMSDGRLLVGDIGMTYREAIEQAEVDQERLNSQGASVVRCGIWNISGQRG